VHFLYSFLIRLAVPLAFIGLVWRGFRDRSYWNDWFERLGGGWPRQVAELNAGIWLHAVSLGEVTAVAPLVLALRTRYPGIPLCVTTATPTGRLRGQTLFGKDVVVRYLPYDTPGSVARFLRNLKPQLGVILETELWPNLYRECERRRIPMLLASARVSEKSVRRYRRFGGLFKELLATNVLVAAQTPEDARRFEALGVAKDHIQVVGNLKFDLAVSDEMRSRGQALRALYCVPNGRGEARPTWIAGSTHAGEEEQVLEAHLSVRALLPNALLLLAPRHPQRFAAVAELLVRRNIAFITRSSEIAPALETAVVLVDSVGELLPLYAAADIAFVGGSLVPVGGHNLLEPLALGLPVLTGPAYFNNSQIAKMLLVQGALLEVADSVHLAHALIELFANPIRARRLGAAGLQVIETNRGSVARLLTLIEPSVVMLPVVMA